MDFYKFINSKDVREHLENIGYKFNALEAAWLVYQNRTATFKEKHVAWQNIIDTMPDYPIEWEHWNVPWNAPLNAPWNAPRESLHAFLKQYMDMQNRWCEAFEKTGDNAVYSYQIFMMPEREYCGDGYAFSDLTTCMSELRKKFACYEHDEINGARIEKRYIDEYLIYYMETDPEGNYFSLRPNIIKVKDYLLYHSSFNRLWFSFPVPFKKGDILFDPSIPNSCTDPLVMLGCTPLDYEETGHKGYDNTDMNVWGYVQKPDGAIYEEPAWNYMNYELYPPEKLTGKRRILKALSNHLKGEIDSVLFAIAYHQILLEENARYHFPKCITDEGMLLAGLKDDT